MNQTFLPSGFSEKIFKERYSFTPEETWPEACQRVANQMAKAESPEKQKIYEEKFKDILQKNLFVPGGRIWYNSGRNNPQLLNCFVLNNELDSKEGWGNIAKEMIVTSMTGGGCGIDFSDVRPNGAAIFGQKGECPGPVALMELIDNCAEPVKAGGQRRVALMFSLDITHPDIEEFLDAKLKKGKLTHANISVRCSNTKEFIKAVKNNSDFELSWKGQYKKTINAKHLWDKIVKNAYNSAEPGFLNWELVASENNIAYTTELCTTNPCLVGSSLIAVADGRNAVSLEQLTKEGKDVPVYSADPKTGQIQIKMGRNPRKTKKNVEVWKLILDDGSELIATPDHRILKTNLEYVELKNLLPGDSIVPFNSYESNGYRQISNVGQKMNGGLHRSRRQYRLIAEFNGVNVNPKTHALHHKDFNSLNDRFENLEVMTHENHNNLHAELKMGNNNPYHKFSDEQKFNFASHPGNTNPTWIDVSNDQLLEHGKIVFNTKGKLSVNDWVKYAKENKLPQFLGNKARFGSFENFRNQIATNHKVISVEFFGYEDVYNITVDDNNNYCVITSNEDDNYITSSGIVVKNCGEIALEKYGNCCLGHIVLFRFIDENGEVAWNALGDTIRTAVRFLDNVLSVNTYPLPEMKDTANKHRRIGLGTTGLADMLVMLGYKYGSDEGNKFIDKLYKFISKSSYEASVMLAVEKGAFPACQPSKHVESGYMKKMTSKIRSLVLEHGIRNCAILTIAPTGTVSILSNNCSAGIEPMFAAAYERRFWVKDKREVELVFHPLFAEFLENGKSVKNFVGSHELTVKEHMEVQKIIQKHIDNAVSKTINMPEEYSMTEMSELWLEYLPHLKGTTFYRENTRGYVDDAGVVHEPPLVALTLKEAKERYNEKHGDVVKELTLRDCTSGVCQI